MNERSQKLESAHRSEQISQVAIESNALVPRKEFWGVFGPFLTVLGLIIFAFLISFYNQSRRYYNYQDIKWKSTIGNINHILYKHNNKGSTLICEISFEVSKIAIPKSEYCNEILTKFPQKSEFLSVETNADVMDKNFAAMFRGELLSVMQKQCIEITLEDYDKQGNRLQRLGRWASFKLVSWSMWLLDVVNRKDSKK